MTLRTTTLRTVTVLAAATIAALPLAGVASAAPAADRDCPDFPSQAAAQAALLPGDPERLDQDGDGLACEDQEYGPGGSAPASVPSSGDADQVTAVPTGSVDAGDGSGNGSGDGESGDGAAAFVLAGFGAVAASGAAVTVWRTRRPARDRG